MTWTSAEDPAIAVEPEGRPAGPAAGPGCLHELIEAQAARTPDEAAVAFEGERLSYRELDRRAGRLAAHLRGRGAGPDVRVGLLVERSLEMVVGILGILKAGAAYLPIDPSHPPERVAFVLADAGAPLLLAHRRLRTALPDGAAEAVDLDTLDWSGPATPGGPWPVDPGHLAYVIYTSGSTGRPKGVCVEHRSIVAYVRAVARRLRLEPGMSHATVSTIAADLGNTVLFPALATGGCLHVVSDERARDRALLADYFEREPIDVLKIVPSHLAALLAGATPARLLPRRRLVLGGEPSRLDWIAGLRAAAPGCDIYNHYGPTEATVGVLTYHVGSELPRTPSGTLPLGRPLPGGRVRLLGADGQPVPDGEPGEIYIGGDGVARGYLDRPELTAERFVADPSDPDARSRWYRTGDLARVLPGGDLEFCGRLDHQVKVNGHRVELGEVEQALRDEAGVRDAAVLAREDASGSRDLMAHVVPARPLQPLWGHDRVGLLPDGSPVAHLNRNETDYLYHEIFVLQAYLRHGIALGEGDCVVDAGANIGLFTVFASRLVRGLRVIALEPNPAAFACLRANAEAWAGGATCLPVGLSSRTGAGDLTFFEGLSLLSGLHADAATEREVVRHYVLNQAAGTGGEPWAAELGELIDGRLRARTVSVPLRTLSEVIAAESIARIDLLKVNVEKSELELLRGIDPADWPRIRQAVIEVDRAEHLGEVTTLLEARGFEVLVEQDPLLRRTELCYVYAVRPTSRSRLVRDQAAGAHLRLVPPAPGDVLTPATLRRRLEARLPRSMVPAAFVLAGELPLTPNGKVDRQALAALAPEPLPAAREPVRPRTETERTLAAIWGELLKVETVGAGDDFFDLGGQSLTAMRAVARIRDAFRVDLPLRSLFEHPTLAALAEVIDGLIWLAAAPERVPGAGAREEIQL
jgi:amino acid adenylation domain-containing protein/FkbM family methyltransferase